MAKTVGCLSWLLKGSLDWGSGVIVSTRVYGKRFPHSKNGNWRRAATCHHTSCTSDPSVTMIIVVVGADVRESIV